MIVQNGDAEHDAFIEKTLLFWSKRAERELTTEEAEEISEGMHKFISILVRWDRQDKLKKTFFLCSVKIVTPIKDEVTL